MRSPPYVSDSLTPTSYLQAHGARNVSVLGLRFVNVPYERNKDKNSSISRRPYQKGRLRTHVLEHLCRTLERCATTKTPCHILTLFSCAVFFFIFLCLSVGCSLRRITSINKSHHQRTTGQQTTSNKENGRPHCNGSGTEHTRLARASRDLLGCCTVEREENDEYSSRFWDFRRGSGKEHGFLTVRAASLP